MKLVFFGGKGGAGKTTSAAAFAIAASAAAVRRPPSTLVVSTDPAHSLGDVLGVKLSSAPRRVAARIDAVELDAARAFARWLRDNRAALAEIFEHGTWLDRADVDALLQLSIPGIDELAAFLEIAKIAEHGSPIRKARKTTHDLIVVDTAPTGHALRLLSAPKTVAAVTDLLDALQERHRLIRDQLARVGGPPEAADRLIAMLAQQAAETSRLFRDKSTTTIRWVTLAEQLSLAESEDAIRALDRDGMTVSYIVINNVLSDDRPCPVCDRRRVEERRTIAAIKRRLGRGRQLAIVPAQLREPRGLKALASLGRHATDGKRPTVDTRNYPQRSATSHQSSRHAHGDAMRVFRGASLLLVGGKGGVGKTTVSAAVAVRLARENPKRRVLLLSIDPAHSLADVFRSPVADTLRAIAGAPDNLRVRELDAARAFSERRARIEAAFDEIASAFGASADRGGSRGVRVQSPSTAAAEVIELAPPGIDELFGMLSVVDARAAYDVIVIDTAPTGHALRLLEMPEVAREWTQVLLRMLLKYRSLVRPGRLAEELLAVAKSIRELQGLLHDAVRTRFIVVTRAAEVPRRETERLAARLRRLRVAMPAMVVNAMTLAPGRCRRCRALATMEARELAMLRKVCAHRCVIIETPVSAPPPRGPRALDSWVGTWTALGAEAAPAPTTGR